MEATDNTECIDWLEERKMEPQISKMGTDRKKKSGTTVGNQESQSKSIPMEHNANQQGIDNSTECRDWDEEE